MALIRIPEAESFPLRRPVRVSTLVVDKQALQESDSGGINNLLIHYGVTLLFWQVKTYCRKDSSVGPRF